LIIVGNVPKEKQEYFDSMIKPHLIERIKYVGTVNDEQKKYWLGNSFAFLMPFIWNEPFGIVMAEAIACGTPVLGFPKRSVPEVIDNGVNGFICNNVDEMFNSAYIMYKINRTKVREIAVKKFSNNFISEED